MTSSKKTVDYIIVGQGLAGSLLAYQLIERGCSVQVFDKSHEGSSSTAAAGIMNPITGRRFVKSWMVDDLFPFAVQCYRGIEKKLQVEFYKEREIVRALFNLKEQNQWDERSVLSAYEDYMDSSPKIDEVEAAVKAPFSWGGLKKAGQLNVPLFLETLKSYFTELACLEQEAFDYKALSWDENGVQYKNYHSKKVIFCEGHQARFNPWFSYLPFVPSKGEMLQIAIPDLTLDLIIKHKSYLVPLENKSWWVGSTYEWNDLSETPGDAGTEQLMRSLSDVLKVPFEVEKVQAAIRPTVKDRRPFLGSHPQHKSLIIFNGLGTKGTSLGPYWADHLCQHLLEGKDLNEEVDINRFET